MFWFCPLGLAKTGRWTRGEGEEEREGTYVDEAMPPPEAQLSLKTLLVPGIIMPLRVLIALAAAAGLGSSTKQ